MQQKPMNVRVRCMAADSIVRKGRAARDESLRKVLRSELSKERATRLEGSFVPRRIITHSQG